MATLRKNASGSLLKKSGTLAIGGCADCTTECAHCKWTCSECSYCGDSEGCEGNEPDCDPGSDDCCTPFYYEVTVAGIVAPPETCLVCEGNSSIAEFSGPEVNGTFLLVQVGACAWERLLGTVSWKAYTSVANCTDLSSDDASVEVTVTGQLYARLTKSSSGYRFEIEGQDFNNHGATGSPYGNVTAYVQAPTSPVPIPHSTAFCNETLSSTGQLWDAKTGSEPPSLHCSASGVGSFAGEAFEVDYDDSDATAEIVPCGTGLIGSGFNVTELLPGGGECGGASLAGCSATGQACCAPNEMEVVFSGVNGTGCSGTPCRTVGSTYFKTDSVSGMDEPHDLAQGGSPYCTWTKTVSNAHQYDLYTNSDCTSAGATNQTENVLITLTKTEDGWTLTAVGVTTGGYIFSGTVLNTPSHCKEVGAMTNALDCSSASTIEDGGSATGSECPS